MWYLVICMQGHRRGVNVYHPHDRNAARDLALEILEGSHKNGRAVCVYISSWLSCGKPNKQMMCSCPDDVQKWMNAECGTCAEWICNGETRRLYMVDALRGSCHLPRQDTSIYYQVVGEPVSVAACFAAVDNFVNEFKGRIEK